LHTNVRNEMVKVVETDMKFLEKKSTFPFISYDQSGHLLPSVSQGEVTNIRA